VSRQQKPSRQASVHERIQVVSAVLKGELSLAEAARRHGVSSATVGNWRDRFVDAGKAGMDRHVRTRVRSPQTNGVVERFFGTLKYEHLYRVTIGDGNALAVEANLFRHTYNTLRPHQALDERTPRAAYLAIEHCD